MEIFKPSKKNILGTIVLTVLLYILLHSNVMGVIMLIMNCPTYSLAIPGGMGIPTPPPGFVECVNNAFYTEIVFLIVLSYFISCMGFFYLNQQKNINIKEKVKS